MLRKLYSKRSGFTLVEIIVAMVIFALMATMVAQILQLSIKTRQSNNAYGEELAAQEERLAKVAKDINDFQNKTDNYSLTFKKTDGTEIGEVKLAYEVKDASGSTSAEGINYFVSPVPYDGKLSGSGSSGGGSVGGSSGGAAGGTSGSTNLSTSMSSLVDVRLTASRGMSYVDILSVEKKGMPSSGAAVRYVFTTSANSSGMNNQDKAFAEYKLYFYLKGMLDTEKSAIICTGTKSDGTEYNYTKDIPQVANIISAGYCDNNGTPTTHSSGKPTVRSSGANCVTVAAPLKDEGGQLTGDNYAGKGFQNETTTFYVDFETDPQITTASFGSNGTPSGGGRRYTKYTTPISGGGSYENNYIYGAYGTTTNPDADGGFVWRKYPDGTILTVDDIS